MLGLSGILKLFRNEFNKFNNIGLSVKWLKYENTLSHACKIFLLHDMLRHWVLFNSSNTCLRFLA